MGGCQNGACRTWVDDEIDAMGEEGKHLPRRWMLRGRRRQAKEAAKMLGELREVDRSTARMQVASNVIGVADEEEEEDDWAKSTTKGGPTAGDQAARLRELKGTAMAAAGRDGEIR